MVWLLAGAAALYVAFWLAVHLRSLIVMLVTSLFLAFALEPAANVLARRGWRRRLATAAVFALVGGALPARPRSLGGAGVPVRALGRGLLALSAAASVQALVSTYLHRYEVVASPLTGSSG